MSGGAVIASIVEGYGEVAALPILIRKIAYEVHSAYDVEVMKPHRVPRGQMTGESLCRAVALQSGRISGRRGGVLVVADSDDDCPVELAELILAAAKCDQSGAVVPEVAIAVREYESWFLASIDSIRIHRAVRDDASYPSDPDTPRGAKGRLESLMTESYRETLHQPSFTEMIDLTLAGRSRSFAHLLRSVSRLLA